jgi:hypothetical protein
LYLNFLTSNYCQVVNSNKTSEQKVVHLQEAQLKVFLQKFRVHA